MSWTRRGRSSITATSDRSRRVRRLSDIFQQPPIGVDRHEIDQQG